MRRRPRTWPLRNVLRVQRRSGRSPGSGPACGGCAWSCCVRFPPFSVDCDVVCVRRAVLECGLCLSAYFHRRLCPVCAAVAVCVSGVMHSCVRSRAQSCCVSRGCSMMRAWTTQCTARRSDACVRALLSIHSAGRAMSSRMTEDCDQHQPHVLPDAGGLLQSTLSVLRTKSHMGQRRSGVWDCVWACILRTKRTNTRVLQAPPHAPLAEGPAAR